MNCPWCEKGNLSQTTYTGRFRFGDRHIFVPNLEGMLCGACGEITIDGPRCKRNEVKVKAAKAAAIKGKYSDRLPLSEVFLEMRARDDS